MFIFLKSSLIRALKITRCLIVVNIFSVSSIQILIPLGRSQERFALDRLQMSEQATVSSENTCANQFTISCVIGSPGTLLVELTNEQSWQYLLTLNLHLFILVYEMPGYTRVTATGLFSPSSKGCFLSELFKPIRLFSSARELCKWVTLVYSLKQPFIFNLAVTLSIEGKLVFETIFNCLQPR